MQQLFISTLHSGGIITNYYCSSRCGHCLYACSPKREKEYLEPDRAKDVFRIIKSMGCHSVHIGGGEPMLDIDKLVNVAKAARMAGVGIDYVETNSSWFRDEDQAATTLHRLMDHGIRQLLVSISPFHNEHIPFFKVKGVLQACRRTGMQLFPWIMDFYRDIDAFDERTVHSLQEYEERYGPGYLARIPLRYWTHFGGRAIHTFRKLLPQKPLEEIAMSPPCHELTDTGHFHIDLYGNYIPGLCTGLAIRSEDLGKGLNGGQYPIIARLFSEGIGSLLSEVKEKYDFTPEPYYLNKCDLCNAIRRFLTGLNGFSSPELKPDSYYGELEENVRTG